MNNSLRPILEASYSKNKKAKQLLEQQNYTLDKRLSTKEAKVFISPTGKPNIAIMCGKSKLQSLLVEHQFAQTSSYPGGNCSILLGPGIWIQAAMIC